MRTAWLAAALLGGAGSAAAAPPVWVGDSVPAPLSATPGDAARGRALVADRRTSLCLLCHPAPLPEQALPGNLAPDLAGSGARWSAGQLRARLVDARRLNPATTMPPFHATDGLARVGGPWQGRPVLDAQQVEDLLAWLLTLQ